jgi:hypothetical protein
MLMFHLLVNYVSSSGATTLAQLNAALDPVFTYTQNNAYSFLDALQLDSVNVMAADATAGQIYSPSLTPYDNINVAELNAAATPSSYPRMDVYLDSPVPLPMGEEIVAYVTDTNSSGEKQTMGWWVSPQGDPRTRITGQKRYRIQFTASYTGVAGKWSGPQNITMQQALRAGWYAVHHAWCLETTSRYFRLWFPRNQMMNGRILKPGDTVQHAVGDMFRPNWAGRFGDWGYFSNVDLLQIETFADTANSAAPTCYLDVDYLGSNPPPALGIAGAAMPSGVTY